MNYNIGDIIKYEDPWYKLSWLKKQFKNKQKNRITISPFFIAPTSFILKHHDKFVITFITISDMIFVTPYNENIEYNKFKFKGDIDELDEVDRFTQLTNSLNDDYIIYLSKL